MPAPKAKLFRVQPRGEPAPGEGEHRRLIHGTRSQVESFLIGELSIEPASPVEAVELGAAGVKVEDAAA